MLIEMSQTGKRALFIFRLDHGIALHMRRIDELKMNVGGAEIPETHQIVYIAAIPDEEPSIVPSRAHRIVAAEPVPREIAQV